MTSVSLLLLAALSALSGLALAGTLTAPLRLEERLAIAVVAAFVLDSIACFLLSLGLGLGPASILLAPTAVTAIALGAARALRAHLLRAWREAWVAAGAADRVGVGMAVVAAVAAVCFTLLFSRAMFQDAAGNLLTGYWIPDWAGHLITAQSFAAAQNLRLQDPLMSGTPLYYPFLPDFTSAMLMRLGFAAGPSLWVPQVVLGVALAVLVVSFAARLGLRRAAGVIAVVICFLGGGLGFVGALHDACTASGSAPAECSAGYVIGHPGAGAAVAAGTLRALPGVVADQPRSYDGMTTAPDSGTPVFSNQVWYTPLFAWWVPQRTLVEGFDVVVAVLILLLASFERARASAWDVGFAGVLAGTLPIVHVQSLFALVIICAVLVVLRWRPAWLLFAAVAAAAALPRVVQLLGAPHGAAATGNGYPYFDPGWMSGALGGAVLPTTAGLSGILTGIGDVLRVPFTGTFWWFWVVNLGVAVPLSALVAAAVLARRAGRGLAHPAARTAVRLSERVLDGLPAPLLRFLVATLLVFALSNVIVFQSWAWDNTKLLLYWYLAVGLVVGGISVRLWRGVGRRLVAILLVGSMVATGGLVVLRLVPWPAQCTGAQAGVAGCAPGTSPLLGPFAIASAQDAVMAREVKAGTPRDAVFLIPASGSAWEDPVELLTGRPVVMGWTGWLWSYGLDYASRQEDVGAAYSAPSLGCAATPIRHCRPVLTVLRRYRVRYVEVNAQVPSADATWWASQGLPIVASSRGEVIYAVGAVTG